MLIWLVWRPHFEITVVCPAPISTAPAFLVLLTHCGCNGESLRGQKAQPRKTGRKPHPSTVPGSGSICCYCCLVSQSCLTLCHSMDAACQASLSITNSQNLLKLMPIEQVMLFNISSSVIPFSSWLQSFTATVSFPVSQFFVSGGQVLEFQLQHQSIQ